MTPRRGGSRLGSIGLLALGLLLVAAAPARYRREDWPHWQRINGGCRDTRAVVLARDAVPGTVEWSPDGCTVTAGEWKDPYTGALFTDPKMLDVDHLIPLQRAHLRGGASWSRERKTAYANALGYRYHLRAVSASANRQKGAQGPDTWRPEKADDCQYGQAYATVAMLSGLWVSEAERTAIGALVAAC